MLKKLKKREACLITAKRIYFVSAPCGAGKTTAAVGYIKENIGNKNFVVVVPTILMVAQWSKALAEAGVSAEALTSHSRDVRVKRIIIERQNAFQPQGNVQIITWNAYSELAFRPPHKNIQIIIDEVPQTDKFFPWNIADHIEELSNVVSLKKQINDRVSEVCAADVDKLRSHLSQPGDDVDMLFDEFKRHISSPYRAVYVDSAAYERVFNRREICRDNRDFNRVGFLSMLNPCLFEGAILLGANIETSILYKWMTQMHEVKFIEHKEILRRLGPQFPRERQLKIFHFLDGDTLASKYRFDCMTASGSTVIDEMDRRAVELFGDKQFLFVANKKRTAKQLEECDGALRLPVDSRGLNSYSGYDNIYFSAALNREPHHLRMLEDLGLGSRDVYRATTCEQAYQSLFRTSLRDKSAKRMVTAIVPDLTTATYIADLVGDADIEHLEIKHEWKAKALTQTQKKQRARAKKSLEQFLASKCIPISILKESGGQINELELENTPQAKRGELAALVIGEFEGRQRIKREKSNHSPCYVTFHDALTDCEPDQHKLKETTAVAFARFLKTQAKNVVGHKEDRSLFNPAVFSRATEGSGWRTLANFQSSSMMVLDFDDGLLSPERFCEIFGPNSGASRQLNFAIYNSFSRSPEQPNRFHVVLFFSQPARSIHEHRAVFDGVVRRLEDEGFNPSVTGLDPVSSRGVQSFYLPATNRAYPEMAFFEAYGVTARELGSAIDPSLYAKTKLAPSTRRARPVELIGVSDAGVEKILNECRKLKSDRHKPLFQAALNLQRFGLTPSQIEVKLMDVFGADKKIKKKISDANKSLARYRSRHGQSAKLGANNSPL